MEADWQGEQMFHEYKLNITKFQVSYVNKKHRESGDDSATYLKNIQRKKN